MSILNGSDILIIDDDKDLSKALSLFFRVQKKNIRMTSSGSAEDAMKILGKKTYNIIICDYWLPGMNGVEFFRMIRKSQPDAKKILVTSYENDVIMQIMAEVEIHGVIRKPLTEKELGKLMIEGGRQMAKEEIQEEIQVEEKKSDSTSPESVIRNHVLGSMGIGLVPIPLLDLLALTGVQVNMLRKLAKIYDIPFSKDKGKNVLASLLGGGVPVVSAGTVGSFIKTIPVVGQTVGVLTMPAIAGALTYAVGKVFMQHFASGGTFLNFKPEEVKEYYEKMFKEGKKFASRLKKDSGSSKTQPASG